MLFEIDLQSNYVLQVLRLPLIVFPFVLSSYASALVSLRRISKFLTAEELAEPYQIEQTLPLAVRINGDFTWETVLGDKKPEEKGKAEEKSDKKPNDEVKSKGKKSKQTKNQTVLPSTIDDDSKIIGKDDSTEEEPPFSLSDLRFEVPKGAFVAIVGRVGCGKVSREATCPLFV